MLHLALVLGSDNKVLTQGIKKTQRERGKNRSPRRADSLFAVAHPLGLGGDSSASLSAAAVATEDPVPELESSPRHEEKQPVGKEEARVRHRCPRLVGVQKRVKPDPYPPERKGPNAKDGAVKRQQRTADVRKEGHPVQGDVPEGKKGVETCKRLKQRSES